MDIIKCIVRECQGSGRLRERIVDLIYPRRCPICGGIVIPRDKKICPECSKILCVIKEPRCKKCSKPIENQEQEFCFDCESKRFHYVRGLALWLYDHNMKQSIANFKYRNKKEYAKFYIEELLRHYSQDLLQMGADAFIPVPIHKSKRRVRGYNQAEIIADGVGKELGIQVIKDLLIRNKNTIAQKTLNNKERYQNLIQAFSLDKYQLKNYNDIKKVILVDDIYTTGSTIEACTNILLQHNIKEVYFISLCIGKGF